LWQHSLQSSLNVAQLFWGACVRRAAPPWLGRWVRSLPVRKREPIPAWIEPSFAARIGLEHLRRQPIFPPPGLSSSGRTRYRNVSHPRPLRPVIEYDRLAGRLGMVFRHPWLDVRLIEFVMAVPTDQTVRAGLRKLVLRNAMQGILPEKVCTRPGKAYPTALAHRGLRERARARVEDLLTDTRMAQCGWVIEGPLRECYARYLAGESNLIWSLWPAITLELWLREHF
jgi:asparagine synthase (glutamine-hydrolysing)